MKKSCLWESTERTHLQFYSKRGNDTVLSLLVRTYVSLFFFRPQKIHHFHVSLLLVSYSVVVVALRPVLLLLLFISYSGLDERCEAHGWVLQDI